TLFPYTTLFRSLDAIGIEFFVAGDGLPTDRGGWVHCSRGRPQGWETSSRHRSCIADGMHGGEMVTITVGGADKSGALARISALLVRSGYPLKGQQLVESASGAK